MQECKSSQAEYPYTLGSVLVNKSLCCVSPKSVGQLKIDRSLGK